MRTTVPPALSPPATPHFRLPLNSSMSLEMANIQQFFTQKNSNFMKLNLTELSMIPPPITIRHSMSVHLIDANICPLLQWQPTPVLLPGQSQGRGSVMDCHLWVAQSRTLLSDFSSPIEILAWLVTNSSAPNTGQK